MIAKRPLRADAQRNRQMVLEVAETVFAAEGLAVPIDEIARRAGLGVGTLYRHFPTKEALFEAIVRRRMERMIEDAHDLVQATEPGDAFFAFLARMVDGTKKDFVDALARTGVDFSSELADARAELRLAMGGLLERAQQAGNVRQDISIADVFALVSGVFVAIDQRGGDAAARQHLFTVVSDGLRPRPNPSDPV